MAFGKRAPKTKIRKTYHQGYIEGIKDVLDRISSLGSVLSRRLNPCETVSIGPTAFTVTTTPHVKVLVWFEIENTSQEDPLDLFSFADGSVLIRPKRKTE